MKLIFFKKNYCNQSISINKLLLLLLLWREENQGLGKTLNKIKAHLFFFFFDFITFQGPLLRTEAVSAG